jgi:hypothetical protein
MRESQMKKIIAAAVAAAFVLPAYAADVTVSGDVEYYFVKGNSGKAYGKAGDQDVTVSGSEDLGNGMTVTAALELDGTDTAVVSDSSLTIAGDFGSIAVGDAVDAAILTVDEASDKAEQGGTGGAATAATNYNVLITPNTGVENLTVAASWGTTTEAAASAKVVTSLAATYTIGGVKLGYGTASKDDAATDTSVTSVSFGVGPISVGYDAISNVDFTEAKDQTNVGVAYAYGQGNVFYESGEVDTSGTKVKTTAYGVSYKLGAVNFYVLNNDSSTAGTEDTYVGVEYAF